MSILTLQMAVVSKQTPDCLSIKQIALPLPQSNMGVNVWNCGRLSGVPLTGSKPYGGAGVPARHIAGKTAFCSL
jgi:hypothetical protein